MVLRAVAVHELNIGHVHSVSTLRSRRVVLIFQRTGELHGVRHAIDLHPAVEKALRLSPGNLLRRERKVALAGLHVEPGVRIIRGGGDNHAVFEHRRSLPGVGPADLRQREAAGAFPTGVRVRRINALPEPPALNAVNLPRRHPHAAVPNHRLLIAHSQQNAESRRRRHLDLLGLLRLRIKSDAGRHRGQHNKDHQPNPSKHGSP